MSVKIIPVMCLGQSDGGAHRTGLKLEPSSWHPREAVCDKEWLRLVAAQVNMFLSPLGLSTEHVVLSGKQPETCERVWSMPRTNIQAAFCSDRDIVWCWAAMSLFSPLAFHSSCAHCSSTLLNCWFSLEWLLEAAVPRDNYSLAILGNMSIGSCYFHLIWSQELKLWSFGVQPRGTSYWSPVPQPHPFHSLESLSSHSPHYLFVVAGAKKKKDTWNSASTIQVERKLGFCLQALHKSPPLSCVF